MLHEKPFALGIKKPLAVSGWSAKGSKGGFNFLYLIIIIIEIIENVTKKT